MQKTVVLLTCDLTGEPAEETVRFALDGAQYEIDLTGVKAKELREALAPFRDAARRTGGRVTSRAASSTTASRAEAASVRAWAQALGLPVADRGRVQASLVARYRAETGT